MNVRWEPFSGIQQRGGQLLRRRRLGRRPAAEAAFPAVECGVDGQQIILRYDEEPS